MRARLPAYFRFAPARLAALDHPARRVAGNPNDSKLSDLRLRDEKRLFGPGTRFLLRSVGIDRLDGNRRLRDGHLADLLAVDVPGDQFPRYTPPKVPDGREDATRCCRSRSNPTT